MTSLAKRDDFTHRTKLALAHRVGMHCSNPNCAKLTAGPQTDPEKALNVGVAAHIEAACEGGARYDAAMAPKQRRSIENGIWLCQTCAKLIDNDAERYPDMRFAMARKHSCTADRTRVLDYLHGSRRFSSHGFVTICYYSCIANDWKPLATLGMRMSRNLSQKKGLCNRSALD